MEKLNNDETVRNKFMFVDDLDEHINLINKHGFNFTKESIKNIVSHNRFAN